MRWVNWLSLLLGITLLAAAFGGCGSPYRDVNLNDGELENRDAPPEARGILQQFEGADALAEASGAQPEYLLQQADRLEVVFFTHPEQNRFVTVRPDGRISMPFLGDLQAMGKRPQDLAREIEAGYQDILIQPRVDVMVERSGAAYYVVGEVKNPGEYEYRRRVSLVQAVAKAGGYTDRARLSNFILMRRTSDGGAVAAALNFRDLMGSPDKRGDIALEPYDIVWVPDDNLSRIENFSDKFLGMVKDTQDIIIRGWQTVEFDEVFKRSFTNAN